MKWYVNVNDMIGGWSVSNLDAPASEHDHRIDGDPNKRSYVVADCMTEDDAKIIVHLLNMVNYKPIALQLGSDAHGIAGWWGNAKVQVDEGVSAQ